LCVPKGPGEEENRTVENGSKFMAEFERTKAYDRLAAAPLIAWYLFGLVKQAPLTWQRLNDLAQGTIQLVDFLQLIALIGSFVMIFLLVYVLLTRRVPELKAKGGLPRAVAIAGSFLGNGFLYLNPVQLSLPAQIFADLLIITSTVGSLLVLSRLGASFSMMPEARKLVTSGPYALIRHPLYLAEMVGVSGLVIQFQQPWALLLGLGVFGLLYWRSEFEEGVLQAAYPEYVAYRTRTPRFIPFIF
jgi:protein-S-isoprenylcysteine O-methyltransferase Ste14